MSKKVKTALIVVAAIAVIIIIARVIVPAVKKSTAYSKSRDVGDTITFGAYEQDNMTLNGKEDLQWIVLAKEGNKMLVISKECIDAYPFNSSMHGEDGEFVNWGTSEVRTWLNDTFINSAFNDSQREMILETNVEATQNPKHDSRSGENTTDKIFLLSTEEAEKYFSSDKERIAGITTYATSSLLQITDEFSGDISGKYAWMLRTAGNEDYSYTFVSKEGVIDYDGKQITEKRTAIRPAMWIEIK